MSLGGKKRKKRKKSYIRGRVHMLLDALGILEDAWKGKE